MSSLDLVINCRLQSSSRRCLIYCKHLRMADEGAPATKYTGTVEDILLCLVGSSAGCWGTQCDTHVTGLSRSDVRLSSRMENPE